MHFGKYLVKNKVTPRERDYINTRLISERYSTKKYHKISELIQESHFWFTWKHKNEDDLFKLVTKIHMLLNIWIYEQERIEFFLRYKNEGESWQAYIGKAIQPMTRKEFDKALHYTKPFHPEYMQAKYEFWRLLMRDF